MSASLFYRVVAGLLVLYAAGHQIGFWQVDPAWGVDGPVAALRTTTFVAQGTANRTYWGFYLGLGVTCTILLLFAAAVAWQLGAVTRETLRSLQFVAWAFAAAFVAATYVTWRYFFTAPVVFSSLITLGLIAAAWKGR